MSFQQQQIKYTASPIRNGSMTLISRLLSRRSLLFDRISFGISKRQFYSLSLPPARSSNLPKKLLAGPFGTIRPFDTIKYKMSSNGTPESIRARIEELVAQNDVVIFSKTTCPFCKKVKGLFQKLEINFTAVELDTMSPAEGALWQDQLKHLTNQRTVPNVFVKGQHIGGCDDTFKANSENRLRALLSGDVAGDQDASNYDYDLIVIGGGSGGLAASKAAGKMGKRVAVCDFVQPTPSGTEWGLGGTCVNVGCIPKKLMHQAALLGEAMGDAPSFGWTNITGPSTHDWATMVENIQMYIKSLNWGYRVTLRDNSVTYLNEYARFVNDHTIETVNKKGEKRTITSNKFLIAAGGRPRYPDIPGALELAITSDDIFSLPHNPGKTLCIGASYIALECAGFLASLNIETSVMVRSILLRGFDQQIAGMIGEYMESHNIEFYRGWVPTEIVKLQDAKDGNPPKLLVKAKQTSGEETLEIKVNTVLLAVGRDACTKQLNLSSVGVELSSSGKIVTNEADQTSVANIFAIGDVAEGRPELTPVAIQAGNLLVKRLFASASTLTDYEKVPTTVFTPLEYGCVGLSEEDAVKKFGADNIEVYHANFQPLEATLSKRDENKSYCKLVCKKNEKERVVGFHYLGPNAGEVTQGFALAIKLGANKEDFDSVIGIHPTCAETFTTLNITKASGDSALKTGC